MTPREVQRTGASSRIDFGMTLECGGCGWRERNGYLVFETSRPVIIVAVDSGGPAARAHLVNDDVILEVNGIPITDARAGRTLGALRSGQAVTLGVWRQGHITAVSVTSRAASTKD